MNALVERRYRLSLVLATLTLIVTAAIPPLLASRQRALRELRAWALGGELLEDDGVVFQTNSANCGHACLMTALVEQRRQVPQGLIYLAEDATVGLTVAELADLARRVGLPAKVMKVPGGCIESAIEIIPLPAIALVGTHYVLLTTRPSDGTVVVLDPSLGRVRRRLDSLRREWREAVIALGAVSGNERVCG